VASIIAHSSTDVVVARWFEPGVIAQPSTLPEADGDGPM
jgi:hypothetical protein